MKNLNILPANLPVSRAFSLLKYIFFFWLLLLMCSCSINAVRPASVFQVNWESSVKNSSVSWWYVGESDTVYFITEKHLFKSYSYEVPKKLIFLVGVPKKEPCKDCEGVKLNYDNIVYR